MTNLTYRLNHTTIDDFKRIKHAEVDLRNTLTVIAGRNEQGKSSVIDAIVSCLAGAKHDPAVPIRRGASKSRVAINIQLPNGEAEAVVEHGANGERKLTVRSLNEFGGKRESPQSLLNELFAQASIDPLKFTSLKPADQASALRQALGINFDELDADRASAYSERTNQNRIVETLKKRFEGIQGVPDGTPDTEINAGEISQKLAEAERHNAQGQTLRAAFDSAITMKNRALTRVQDLREQLARAEEMLESETKAFEAADLALGSFEPQDVEPLREQIASIDATNANVRLKRELTRARGEYIEARNASQSLTAQIEQIDAEKRRLTAEAKFPVPGLSFGEDGLLLNDLPFEQASSAQKLTVAVHLALAQCKRLKLVIIRDGSLLDDEHMALVAQIATDAGGQVIIERVGDYEGEGVTVTLEEGAVKTSEPGHENEVGL